MAAVSFDLPPTASRPSTSRWRAARAETRCGGSRPLPRSRVRREVLPSTATRPGPASRKPPTQPAKQPSSSAGPRAANHPAERVAARHAVLAGQEAAQEGRMPVAPERDLDEVVRPASVAQSSRRRISGKG